MEDKLNDWSELDLQMQDCYRDMEIYDNETDRINNRIFKAIENQIGKGYLNTLKSLIEETECKDRFKIVSEPEHYAKFQEESDYGCIVGMWVYQYSVGDSGDSYEGTIWVKLKDYKYLEMPFSC